MSMSVDDSSDKFAYKLEKYPKAGTPNAIRYFQINSQDQKVTNQCSQCLTYRKYSICCRE